MKTNLNIEVRSEKLGARNTLQTSNFKLLTSSRRSGIALIITLILLSVTLVMAVAFLALSRRERGAVTTSTDTATARLAADAGLANAEAEIMANVLSTTNPYSFGLIVSTNYINGAGFAPGFNNVNYDYSAAAGNPPLTPAEFLENLTNLFYSPRAPVFVTTNNLGLNDFRFYLDLNRNGRFDTNGVVDVFDANGIFLHDTAFEVGDPEWIGVLERPDAPHGPNNQFLSRYAFIALPAGNALDLNAIHNQTLQANKLPLNLANDGYYRNQGVGSWEINLAAFLADLNTNQWDNPVSGLYQYNQATNPAYATPNTGASFNDAFALLSFRYADNYNFLAPVGGVIPSGLFTISTTTFPPFQNNIDIYSDLQPPMIVPASVNASGQKITLPWAGADNTNRFFDLTADLFDPTKSSTAFTNHLQQAGTGTSTYDRYTFYRLLSQMGTDSDPESGKMNLNYDNLTPVNGVASATNFLAWTPLGFFTNAADRMLRLYTTNWLANDSNNFTATFNVTNSFGITDIPVLVSNKFVYTPSVQRVLQLAANIYDASVTNFYPSRFRPTFLVTNENGFNDVYIDGYVQQTNPIVQASEFQAASNPDLATPVEVTSLPVGRNILANVYGVPWIIGAKTGLPNFNEFSMENAFQITRKLQVTRSSSTWPWQFGTNQMYIMSITNFFGVECWNSYKSSYYGGGTVNPGLVDIMVRDNMFLELTNASGLTYVNNPTNWAVLSTSFLSPQVWPGYQSIHTNSFLIPLNTSAVLFTNDVLFFNQPSPPNSQFFIPESPTFQNYLDKGTPPLPQLGLMTTNRLQVAIVDYSAGPSQGQIIDYVQLNDMDSGRDLNAEIADADPAHTAHTGLWDTNLYGGNGGNGGIPQGVINQIQTSSRGGSVPAVDQVDGETWGPVPGLPPGLSLAAQHAYEQFYLSLFLSRNSSGVFVDQDPPYARYPVTITTNAVQAPYTPTRTRVQRLTWQANDPLVHYLANDLADLGGMIEDTNTQDVVDWGSWPGIFGEPNYRYMPWGSYDNLSAPDFKTANAWNMALKDPMVTNSDSWDFPTNTFPTVGWLGRVHRGTPWQTVYLKSTDILANNNVSSWQTWTGNGNPFDATNTAPTWDWLLFDVFTTAPNDNATRGQLSINVGAPNGPNLAAWSALFSGIVVPGTNNTYSVIQPAGVFDPTQPVTNEPPLVQIVQGIYNTRTNMNLFPQQVFGHVGDILAVPQLTVQSPFIAPFISSSLTNQLRDEVYEWLPQQIMSLVRVENSPRYVIYSFGQTLRPAPGSVVTSGGPFFQMVTNYQVVAETATRAVVRVENPPTPQNTNASPHIVLENFTILPPN